MESTLGHWIALVSFVIAAISDFLDGYLARKLGMVTTMGKLLDPLADKILVSAAFIYLSSKGLCPVWITVTIIAREFLVTGLRQIAMESGFAMAADRLGKWKTAWQLVFCITCLVWITLETSTSQNPIFLLLKTLAHPNNHLQPISMWLAFILTILSGWNYLWNSRSFLKH